MKQKATSRNIKILVAKLGLDGHDRGALVLCRAFRDAGMEVIYSGLFATPDRVAQIAEDEDVDAVAMSLLNGAHGTLFPRVVKTLKKKGISDVLIVGGGEFQRLITKIWLNPEWIMCLAQVHRCQQSLNISTQAYQN